MGSPVKPGSVALLVLSAVLAVLSTPAGESGGQTARSAVGLLAVLLAALALALQRTSSSVLICDVRRHDWRIHRGAYEYIIKRRRARGRRRVTVTMPLPDGREAEVLADVVQTEDGDITVRAGSPEHVTVYVD